MDYALSLRPEYHQAILDVITYYGWKNIIYLYDSHDGKFSSVCLERWTKDFCHFVAIEGREIALGDYLLTILPFFCAVFVSIKWGNGKI